jgi:hypothetical protein
MKNFKDKAIFTTSRNEVSHEILQGFFDSSRLWHGYYGFGNRGAYGVCVGWEICGVGCIKKTRRGQGSRGLQVCRNGHREQPGSDTPLSIFTFHIHTIL